MRKMMKLGMVLFLMLAMMTACSQKSGTDEQAKSSGQEQSQADSQQQAVQQQEQAPMTQQQEEAPVAQQQMEQSDQEQAQAEGMLSDQVVGQVDEISGTVIKTDEGIAIFSDAGNYMVAGQDLTDLVGKNVKVTGTVDEGAGKPVITISSVSVIE